MRGEMEDEEKRLDMMMEVDRQNAIKIQEEIEKKRKEERLLGKFCGRLDGSSIKYWDKSACQSK